MGVGEKQKKKELEAWELKLIGRKKRYTDSWLGKLVANFWEQGEAGFDRIVGTALDYVGDSTGAQAKSYELYGKKVDRAWGFGQNLKNKGISHVLKSDCVKQNLSQLLKKKLGHPDQLYSVSGAVVAATCFAAADAHNDVHIPIRFEDADMIAFYNELGIVPDQEAMLIDMYNETCKIKQACYTDEQWRTTIMPIILSESYKKQLNNVYRILHEEYMRTPAISEELLSERMDKAQQLLGKIYQGFSRSLANHTEYLESPINILESDPPRELTEELAGSLSETELKKYQGRQTAALVNQREADRFKKTFLKAKRTENKEELILSFFLSLGGHAGKEAQQNAGFYPAAIAEDHSTRNCTSFINSVAALKKLSGLLSGSKDPEEKKIYAILREDLSMAFGISADEVKELLKPEMTLADIRTKYGITDEAFYGYEKIDLKQELITERENDQFLKRFVRTMGRTVAEGVRNVTDLVVEKGSVVYKTVSEVGSVLVHGVQIGEIEVDITEDDIMMDLFRDPDERWADFKAEQEKKEAQEAQRRAKEDREREERQRELERQMQVVRERIQQLIRAGEEAAERTRRERERDEALRVLEPWQKKLIGHQARYTDGWIGKILHGISDNFGEAINSGVDKLLHFFGESINPQLEQYEIYGRKLDRPWSKGYAIGLSLFEHMIESETASGMLKTLIQRRLLASGVEQYASGELVAFTCFAPTLIHGEMRPPCHFDPVLMAKFYNETGILPDEVSIVSDMMEETMKIADSNYTDVQWRTKLMPTIIKGSYHRQLELVFDMLKEEYLGNPAMSEEILQDRMKKAAHGLGEMYTDFTRSIANMTEYLEAPMNFLDTDAKLSFPESVADVMTDEQKQLAETLETKSITSEKEIDRLIKTHAKVKRKDTAQSLCEQFFMATSGAIGQQRNYVYYTPVPYDAENRNVFNEKCMIGAIAAAKKLSAILASKEEKRGFFSKLFHRNEPVEERMILMAMKDALQSHYGFSSEQVEEMLKPEVSLASVRETLGITDEVICGIDRMEIPPHETMEDKQKTYVNTARNLINKGIPVVATFAIGATKLIAKGVVTGGKCLLKKTADWAYDRFWGGSRAEETEDDKEEIVMLELQKEKLEKAIETERETTEKIQAMRGISLSDVEELQVEQDVISQLADIVEQENIGWTAWGLKALSNIVSSSYYYLVGAPEEVAVQQVHEQIAAKKQDVLRTLQNMDEADRESIYEKMAWLDCLIKLNKGMTDGRISPKKAKETLDNDGLSAFVQKSVSSERFQKACDKLIRAKLAEIRSGQQKVSEEDLPVAPGAGNVAENVQPQMAESEKIKMSNTATKEQLT